MPAEDLRLHWKPDCPLTGGAARACNCTWPLWHVSVAVQQHPALPAPLPVRRWNPKQREEVRRLAVGALAGVGDLTRRFWETGHVAVHLRRPCTPAEVAQLPTPWQFT